MRIVSLLPEATAILAHLTVPCTSIQAAIAGGDTPIPPGLFHGADIIFAAQTRAGGWLPRFTVRKAIAQLRPRPAVYALEPHTFGDLLSDIKTVGDATGQQQAARALIERQRARIDAVTLHAAQMLALAGSPDYSPDQRPPRRVALLATREPLTAAGWWQAELIGLAGGHDVLGGQGRPPRAVTWGEIDAARPEIVVAVDDPGRPHPPAPSPARRGGDEDLLLPLSSQERGLRGEVSPELRGGGVAMWHDPVDLLEALATLLTDVATRPS